MKHAHVKAHILSKWHEAWEYRCEARATPSQYEEEKMRTMLARREAQRVHIVKVLREACQAYSRTLSKHAADEISSEARTLKIEHMARMKVLETHALKTMYVVRTQVLETHTTKPQYAVRAHALETYDGKTRSEACANKRVPLDSATEFETRVFRRTYCFVDSEFEARLQARCSIY